MSIIPKVFPNEKQRIVSRTQVITTRKTVAAAVRRTRLRCANGCIINWPLCSKHDFPWKRLASSVVDVDVRFQCDTAGAVGRVMPLSSCFASGCNTYTGVNWRVGACPCGARPTCCFLSISFKASPENQLSWLAGSVALCR